MSNYVHCSQCGKQVSNQTNTEMVVRAWVQCPECTEKAPDYQVKYEQLREAAQAVVDAEYIFRHDMGAQGLLVASRRLTKAISDLAAVLEELR